MKQPRSKDIRWLTKMFDKIEVYEINKKSSLSREINEKSYKAWEKK